MTPPRFRVEWISGTTTLTAIEPRADEIQTHAHALADAYNEPHNRSMMGHDPMSVGDVADYFGRGREAGGRLFLLLLDGALAGDADFRHVEDDHAEFAIMIGARTGQGKGLGTRFAIMLHAFAFRTLRLDRVYVTILHANAASRRLFEKLGYGVDGGAVARALVDHDDDIAMSISRDEFERLHAGALAEIHVAELAGVR